VKVKISWVSVNGGQQSEIVESATTWGAQDQISSKYRDVPGFRINGLSVIPDYLSDKTEPTNYSVKETYYEPESSNNSSGLSIFQEIICNLYAGFALVGAGVIFWGICTPPGGILLIILGALMIWLPLHAIENW
jgi:hypothetical protein